tara:strand:- start:405 stop:1535 length:1131 start_codon:yes stop_codon:yes gene_type:complete
MKKLTTYKDFSSLKEEDSATLSKLDQFRPIAAGVAEAFALYGYFVSIAEENIDASDWSSLITAITGTKTYDQKWKQIISLSKSLHNTLKQYSAEKNKNVGYRYMEIKDIGAEAIGITEALEKFKVASDLLVKDMSPEKIQNRLKMIDDALSNVKPFGVNESVINEAEKKPAPAEAAVLYFADSLASQVVNMRLTLRYLADVYPDSEASIQATESNILDPLAEEIKKILDMGIKPNENLPLSKSVKNAYEDKGWKIDNQFQKYMVDAYDELSTIESRILDVYKKIEEYKGRVVNKYQSSTDAGEFIEAGNRILKGVKDKILKQLQIQRLEKKSGQIIAGSYERQMKRSLDAEDLKTQDALVNADQLRDFLKKKYQVD